MIDILSETIKAAEESFRQNDNDYTGSDGLLYCGTCGKAKQYRFELFGIERTVPCNCSCMAKAYEEEKLKHEEQEKEQTIERTRSIAFQNADMCKWRFEADDGTNPKITLAMKNYVLHFSEFYEKGKGMILYGTPGTGKTFAACMAANALIDKGYTVLVTTIPRIVNCTDEETRREYMDGFRRYDLIVLDDIGTERNTEYMQEQVFSIIDGRYRAGLPMIITSNVSNEQFKNPDSLSKQRIFDRLKECCFPLPVVGISRRNAKGTEDYADMKKLLGI